MDKQDILLLFDYNYWANRRVMSAAAKAGAAQFVAPAPFSYGSLRGTLVHTLEAESTWRMRLQNVVPAEIDEADFPDVETLRQRWDADDLAMRGYLDSLHDADLSAMMRYPVPGNMIRERVVWHCLVHVVNHGTQHRSEAAAILTGYSQSPGDIDFTVFLNEHFSQSG